MNLKNYHAKIEGDRVYLKTLDIENASQEYCDWLNDKEVNKYLETRQSTINDLKQYINKQLTDPNSFFVGIFDKKSNRHIGNIKLEPIDWRRKKAVYGILIGNKKYWGKGFGAEATRLIIEYAFEKLELKSIELGVIPQNKNAVKLYKKLKFRVKKIEKKVINHDGILYDKVTMIIKK